MQAQPPLGVQCSTNLRLQGQRQISISGAETVRPITVWQARCQFLLYLIASGLHPGTAAGIQNNRLGHIACLFRTQKRLEPCPQSTGQQHGLVTLFQHVCRVHARQQQINLR